LNFHLLVLRQVAAEQLDGLLWRNRELDLTDQVVHFLLLQLGFIDLLSALERFAFLLLAVGNLLPNLCLQLLFQKLKLWILLLLLLLEALCLLEAFFLA